MSLHRPQRNWGARVHESTYAGLDAVVVENAALRVTLLTGKGGDLVELLYKPRDLDFAWLAPGGVRDPRTLAHAGDAFMESYAGGWQDILPSAGTPSEHAGASYGQHGESSLVPWDCAIVEDTEPRVTVRLTVALRKSPLRLVKDVTLGTGAQLEVASTLINESDQPVELMWLMHLVYGRPFLRSSCRVELPDGVRVVAGDRLDAAVVPQPGQPSRIAYLGRFGDEGAYAIRDPERGLGLAVHWDARVMPYLWVWHEAGADAGAPWWGRAHVLGLEPCTSHPTAGLAEAVRNGTALTLAPRERRPFALTAAVLDGERPDDHEGRYATHNR